MSKAIVLKMSKGESLSYMEVKFLSECVEAERRYVRMKIHEYRELKRQLKKRTNRNIICFKSMITLVSSKKAVLKAFQRYSLSTRLWGKACCAYMDELDRKNPYKRKRIV